MFDHEDDALVFVKDGVTTRVEAWGADTLRVRFTALARIPSDIPSVLLDVPKGKATVAIEEKIATITHGTIRATIKSNAGRMAFYGPEGVLLEESEYFQHWEPSRRLRSIMGGLFRCEVIFEPKVNERFYGMGQHRFDTLDLKGTSFDLMQANASHVNIPFVISSRGYGFFWNMPGTGRAAFAKNRTHFAADGCRVMDYFVIHGKTPAEILERYCALTGRPPVIPQWASGFWQCKLRYSTQDEILSIARKYKEEKLPISVIVIDYFHWTKQGEWKFDPECWPDPQAMVDELKSMGIELMVSVWPTVNRTAETFDRMMDSGYIIRGESGMPASKVFTDTNINGPVYLHNYDASNPGARKYVWNRIREGYGKYGIKVFWLDACEPEIDDYEMSNMRLSAGNGREVSAMYPFWNQQTFADGFAADDIRDGFLLCRSAFAGSQRFPAAVWSGDIRTTFEELTRQVRTGLNMAMSGISWWTTDIGGFNGGDVNDPAYREVIIRWFQYGAFCPIFRLHGFRLPQASEKSGGPNEVWSYGEEAYTIMRAFLELRERLRPYIMECAMTASRKGAPPMRPLFYDFPDDPQAWNVEDQFMFGPHLVVAPVTQMGKRSRDVYLPAGRSWINAWTGKEHEGGKMFSEDAPIEQIPLFVQKGAEVLAEIRPSH